MTPLGYYNESNCPANTAFVISAGAAGEVGYSSVDFWAADDCFYFICPETLHSRFLYYVLMTKREHLLSKVRRASVPRLARTVIETLLIPLPPLPIQAEIVRILDTFAELTTQLTAQLTAELTARKKQYEYYRDKLLTFDREDEGVRWVRLGEVAKIGDGLHGTPKYDEKGSVYFINGNNIGNGLITFYNNTKKVKETADIFDASTMFMSINGTIGSVALYNGESIMLGKSVAYFNVNEKNINRKFLYYFLQASYSKEFYEKSLTGSTIKNLGLKSLREFEIPLPTLAEQSRIVSILDKFDKLTTSLTEGLPAEIAARKKQYEYYRDKLLTFKKKA